MYDHVIIIMKSNGNITLYCLWSPRHGSNEDVDTNNYSAPPKARVTASWRCGVKQWCEPNGFTWFHPRTYVNLLCICIALDPNFKLKLSCWIDDLVIFISLIESEMATKRNQTSVDIASGPGNAHGISLTHVVESDFRFILREATKVRKGTSRVITQCLNGTPKNSLPSNEFDHNKYNVLGIRISQDWLHINVT